MRHLWSQFVACNNTFLCIRTHSFCCEVITLDLEVCMRFFDVPNLTDGSGVVWVGLGDYHFVQDLLITRTYHPRSRHYASRAWFKGFSCSWVTIQWYHVQKRFKKESSCLYRIVTWDYYSNCKRKYSTQAVRMPWYIDLVADMSRFMASGTSWSVTICSRRNLSVSCPW